MPYIIQFMHPGGQPPYHRHHSSLPWNHFTNPHYRKFIRNKILFLEENSDKPREEELFFWGEWEPPSTFTLTSLSNPYPVAFNDLPTQIRYPGGNLHNTDPYVFDGQFFYTNCQQIRKGSPTRLQKLPPGSMILFGSKIDGQFVLDTLFIVQDSFAYQADNLASVLPKQYYTDRFDHAVMRPLANTAHNKRLRFYVGSTYNKPFLVGDNAIFSFVPCSHRYFQRPVIDSPYINQKLSQGFKSTNLSDQEILNEWHEIVKQVYENKLCLGVAVL